MTRFGFPTLLLASALPAFAAVSDPAGISDALRPPADEQAAFVLNATGVQVYTCKAKDSTTYAWTFVAPVAELMESGATVGKHFAGPTWESTSDGSSVKGAVKERQDGGAGNIPWLRLATTSTGQGRFAGVTSVLRVATKGGVEPASGCGEYFVGQESRVPYTADYYFYKKK
ncbi:MAG TPA: DUF3455 domain-containing protein [Usitatibacter sp.]